MRATLPPEIIHAIRLPTWHSLFAAYGYPSAITRATQSLDAIAKALQSADLSLRLARAIFTIAAFATPAGRVDLYDAAAALAFATRWPDATSPADLVAQLLAEAATDDAVRELLEAAQILRDRSFRPRATHVYVGAPNVAESIGEPTQYDAAWRAEMGAWCALRDFGDVVAITSSSSPTAVTYVIAHEDRWETQVVATPPARKAQPRIVATAQRALRSHEVIYEPQVRKLSITTDCMEAVTPLATIAGRVFFQSARHFLEEDAIDLWTLQENGVAALEVPELASKVTVSAIGGTWHSGKGHAITPRGNDFFKALARYKIRIEGGRLDLVTLRARPSAKLAATLAADPHAPTQCDVALRPPHLVTVSEPELAPLMREFLDYAKITTPDPRPADFFSRQPWNDFRAGWIATEGRSGFDRLVTAGVLKADPRNRDVVPPDQPHAGRTATAYPLRGTRFLARSADPTIAPFIIEEKYLIVYTLSFAKLAAFIAKILKLEGPATSLDDDGVLLCGRRTLGPTHVWVWLLTRPIRAATVDRLSEAAGHGHAVLITPAGRMQKHGLRQVAMPNLAGPWHPLLAAIVRGLRLESFVDTTLYAPESARVVLHRATMRAWIDGVLCAAFTENHFRLVEILLMNAGKPMHTKEIADHVARGNPTEDTTRRTLDSLTAAIEKSFKKQRKALPADIRELVVSPRYAHYAITVPGFID